MLTLYYSPGACSLASHIALLENKLKFNLKKVDLKTHTTEDQIELSSLNPKNYVPVLQLDNQQTLSEGAAILFYIAEQGHANNTTSHQDPFAKYRLQEWLTFISSELHKNLGSFFNKTLSGEYKNSLIAKIKSRFDYLEATLHKHAFLCGEQFSAADAYCFTILNWLSNLDTGLNIADWPKLQDYATRVASRPAVQQAMSEEGLLK